jgi:hypothetical protein
MNSSRRRWRMRVTSSDAGFFCGCILHHCSKEEKLTSSRRTAQQKLGNTGVFMSQRSISSFLTSPIF